MGIKSISKRADFGRRLLALEVQAGATLEELERLKISLPSLREQIEIDPDLTQDEKDDAVAEVNASIVSIVSQVKAFADSL